MIKYFSAFSGIGGFDLGIERAIPGSICAGYSEVDRHAIKIYENHYPDRTNYGDIRKIKAKEHRGHTLYGYPTHRKCMIEYTAWEISKENPGISESESRILQVRRNLEHLYRRLEIHGNELRNHGHNKTA